MRKEETASVPPNQGKSPKKPSSYAVVAQLGYQRNNDEEEEGEYDIEDERDQLGYESEEETNPYKQNLDVDAGAHVLHEDLISSLVHLPKVLDKVKPSMRIETLVVDKNVVVGYLVHLQKRGIILYTVDFNLSRDAFES